MSLNRSLINIYDEISQHAFMLIVKYDHPTFELSNKKCSKTTKVGIMANLPTMRIIKYYRCIGHYNNFLQAKIAELERLVTLIGIKSLMLRLIN